MSDRVLAECGIAPLRSRTVGDWQFCALGVGRLDFPNPSSQLECAPNTQAVVCTSPKVAHWLVQGPKVAVPVFTSGPATLAIFQEAGWEAYAPLTEGGAGACAALEARLAGVSGSILYPCVAESAGTVERFLQNHPRFGLQRVPVCENRCALELPPDSEVILQQCRAIWFRSPSALRHLYQLAPARFTLLSQTTLALSGPECVPLLQHHHWQQSQICSSVASEIVQILQKVFP